VKFFENTINKGITLNPELINTFKSNPHPFGARSVAEVEKG